MKITDEYKRQANWRNWDSYLDCLPLEKEHTVLDLGCGIGSISKLLAAKSSKVIGIDLNQELLDNAELENKNEIKLRRKVTSRIYRSSHHLKTQTKKTNHKSAESAR